MDGFETVVINRLTGEKGSMFNGDVKVADLKNVTIDEEITYKTSNLGRVPVRKRIEVHYENAVINFDRLDLFGVGRGPDGEYSMADTNTVTLFDVVTVGHLNGETLKRARVLDVYLEGLSTVSIMMKGKIPLSGNGKDVIFSDP
jgi:hypothetical protein